MLEYRVVDPEVEQLATVLKAAIRALGLSVREVERRLGFSAGYLSRVLGGKVELRVDHVCSIARSIGLKPAEVFQAAFPLTAEPPSEAARRIQKALAPGPGTWAASPPSRGTEPEQVEDMLEKTLRRLFRELGRPEAG